MSNEVGGDLISTARFVGVDLRDVLRDAGVRDGAEQLLSTSVDGWTAGTPTAVVLEPDRGALLAVGMNGEALPREHGFPVRMVVPGLYGFVSATKWVTDLELTTFAARDSYWLQRGWAQQAPIKTQSRIDRPRAFGSVPAGPVLLAGTAWAQHTGVERVEVRADDGPWQTRGTRHRGEPRHVADVAGRARPRARPARAAVPGHGQVGRDPARAAHRPCSGRGGGLALGGRHRRPDRARPTAARTRPPARAREHDPPQDRNFVHAFTSGYRGGASPSIPRPHAFTAAGYRDRPDFDRPRSASA